MTEDFLQPKTVKEQIQIMFDGNSPVHGFLLCGDDGLGKSTIALMAAARWLKIDVHHLDTNPAVHKVDSTGSSIGIDEIRSVAQFLHLKTVGSGHVRRVVILLGAQSMTMEAQNALLKTLEEPPGDTKIIITATSEQALRPTILSRVQTVHLQPVGLKEATAYFVAKGFSQENILQAFRLSQGASGLMTQLLDVQDIAHPFAVAVDDAKVLLKQPVYERLTKVESLAKDKHQIDMLLSAIKLIANAGLRQALEQKASHSRWQNILKQVQSAQYMMRYNINTKILLTNLFVNL